MVWTWSPRTPADAPGRGGAPGLVGRAWVSWSAGMIPCSCYSSRPRITITARSGGTVVPFQRGPVASCRVPCPGRGAGGALRLAALGLGLLLGAGRAPAQESRAQEAGVPAAEVLTLERAISLAREKSRGQRQATVAEVKQAYYSLLETESALRATDEAVRALRELARVVGERLAQQAALKAEDLSVRSRLAGEEHQALQERNALVSGRERLNDLLGRDLDTAFGVSP